MPEGELGNGGAMATECSEKHARKRNVRKRVKAAIEMRKAEETRAQDDGGGRYRSKPGEGKAAIQQFLCTSDQATEMD